MEILTGLSRATVLSVSVFFMLLDTSYGVSKFEIQITKPSLTLEVSLITKGLNIPWAMEFLDSNTIITTERSGRLLLIDIRNGKAMEVAGVPKVWNKGQGGLLDVAVNQPYTPNDWIYFTYSKALPNGAVTALAKAKLENNQLKQWTDLLITQSASDTSRHFGSRITFGKEQSIYFTVGDRGVRPNGQRLDVHAGKVLRVGLNGKALSSNPFVSQKGALPEIWSYGHRNPQGIVYDAVENRLWAIEHGPRGGDEINLIKAGLNYGWPIVSHGKEYWGPVSVGEATEKPGMENPVKVYIPSIAPSSLMLYQGNKIKPWKGNLFAGALAQKHLNRIVLDKNGNVSKEERYFEELGERIRDVIQGPDEFVYFSTDNGNIYQVRPKE